MNLMHYRNTVFTILITSLLSGSSLAQDIADRLKQFAKDIEAIETQKKQSDAKNNLDNFRNSKNPNERMLASLALGLYYYNHNKMLSYQYLTIAESLVKSNKIFYDLVAFYKAKIKFEENVIPQTITILEGLLRTPPVDPSLENLVYELLLRSLWAVKDSKKFARYYKKYCRKYPIHRQEEEIIKLAAINMSRRSNYKAHIKLLEHLAQSYPETNASKWAFEKLVTLSQAKKPANTQYYYNFSLKFLRKISRNHTPANGLRGRIANLLDGSVVVGGRAKVLSDTEKIGALIKVRDYDRALKAASKMVSTDSSSDTQMQLAKTKAKIYYLLGKYGKSEYFSDKYLTDIQNKSKVLRLRAVVLMRQKKHQLAAVEYRKLARISSKKSNRWNHFWNLYLGRDYHSALAVLNQRGYVKNLDRVEKFGTDYWRAKIYLELGKKRQAIQIFRDILAEPQENYYASIIATIYPEIDPRDSLIAADFYQIPSSRISIRQFFHKSDMDLNVKGSNLTVPLPSLANFYDNYASSSLSAYDTRLNPKFTYNRYLLLANDDTSSHGIPHGIKQLYFHRYENPSPSWKANYPLAYDTILDPIARIVGIDKFLLLSVIRAESYYNPYATSPVGAKGLMQLMPYTFIKIGKLLKAPKTRIAKRGDPLTNLVYGSFYLKTLIDYYGGNYLVALAAYNAGPKATKGWLLSCGKCTSDEFVETVSYNETRAYIKKITKYYSQYRRIYLGISYLDKIPEIPQSLDPNIEIF